jgi:hypothetical protein
MTEIQPGDTVRITDNGNQFGRTATAIRMGEHGKWFCQVLDDDGRDYTRWLHQSDLKPMGNDGVDVADRQGGYGDSVHSAAHHISSNRILR